MQYILHVQASFSLEYVLMGCVLNSAGFIITRDIPCILNPSGKKTIDDILEQDSARAHIPSSRTLLSALWQAYFRSKHGSTPSPSCYAFLLNN
jgi:hypothetical protein